MSWEALQFFAEKARERAEQRERDGLPPEPVKPTREALIEILAKPNALLAALSPTGPDQ